jgi:HSP20 family protein
MTDVRVTRERDEAARDWGVGDVGVTTRKRKYYDRDYDQGELDRTSRGFDYPRRVGFGGLDPFNYGDIYGPYGRRNYGAIDYGYYPYGTAYGLGTLGTAVTGFPFYPPRPQGIGEAGYDLGIRRRGVPEDKYRKLPDYTRVAANPSIDEDTLWRPRADIFEQDTGLRVEFELPGVPREDISLTVTENAVTLTALKPQTRKEEVGFHFQNERHFGKFYRRLALPYSVDPNSVRAHLDHGVLKVHFTRSDTVGRVPISTSGDTTSATTNATGSTPSSAGI